MSDGFVEVPEQYGGKKIDNAVLTVNGASVYRQRVETYNGSSANVDLDGSSRSSQKQTLFDGKIYNAEDSNKWDIKGTGSNTYSNNAVSLSVTAGQYEIRQSRFFVPYFSGKPQLIEATSLDFNLQAGVVKRIGYYSSNAVAPYNSSKDGWWIECDGDTEAYYLVTSNNGTETHRIAWTSWDGYSYIQNYNWSKFTVFKVDFLWLGGAGLRLFMVIDGAWKLIHTIADHAGYSATLIFNNPNQPVRYEIRSTTGAGSMVSVCSQVSTEGASPNEQGQGLAIYTPSIACNVIGTVYALAGMRKVAAYRNHHVLVSEFGATNIQTATTPEAGVLLLMLNPTLSAPLTWTANSRIETAIATTQTITNTGRILKAIPMAGSSVASPAPQAALRVLQVGIDNTMGQIVLGYSALTTTQNMSGYMQALEY